MLPKFLTSGAPNDTLSTLYGDDDESQYRQLARYREVCRRFVRLFGSDPNHMFSSPGRCELAGNHTDHNGGRVLAAAINLDILAAVSPSDRPVLTVYSHGFEHSFVVDLSSLEPNQSEHPTSQLLRGIAAGFVRRGHKIGGFNVLMNSEVLFASGLSSSAAIEILFGQLFNQVYNDSAIDVRELAMIGRESEHLFWGKPVGLLDQLTIGLGGLVYMSFEDPLSPAIEEINFSFDALQYQLVLVNPGGNHSSLTGEYRQIPLEMMRVAQYFKKNRLIEITLSEVLTGLRELRGAVGDRAILRALHFFTENDRVLRQARILQAGEFKAFLDLIRESGSSSWRLLQNCYQPHHPNTQPISLALAMTEILGHRFGADVGYRVHGGGFGGTILAIVPLSSLQLYRQELDSVFGRSATTPLRVRPIGCVNVAQLEASQRTSPRVA